MALTDLSTTVNGSAPTSAVVNSAANTVTCAVAGVESEAAALAGTIANAAANVVGGVIGNVENAALGAISSAVNSVTSTLTADAASIANGISSKIGTLFTNTLSGIGVDVKLPIPDALASSFATGVKSTLFSTNSILSQAEAVTFGVIKTVTNALNLQSLLTRYGLTSSTSLSSTVQNDLLQTALSGLFGLAAGAITGSAGTACTTAAYEGAGSSYAGYTDYASLAGSLASSLTGDSTGLNSFYNPYLPTTTDQSGDAFDDMSNNVSAGTINQITATLNQTLGLDTITLQALPYAAQQSLFDGIYAVSASLGLVDLMQQMAASPKFFGPSTIAQAQALVPNAYNQPKLAAALIAAAGASSISLPASWSTKLVTNNALTVADVSTVTTLLADLNTPITPILSTAAPVASGLTSASNTSIPGTPVTGGGTVAPLPIWNTSTLGMINTPVAKALLATSPATIEGATTADLPTTNLPAAATIALMARGTPRTLTPNLRFKPLTAKSPPAVLYGNLMSQI